LYQELKDAHGDLHKIEVVSKKADKLFELIKAERKNGFEGESNEMNTGNLTFKALRRMNYIEKIVNLKEKTYNIINSLSQ
jgi:hypothetical protein